MQAQHDSEWVFTTRNDPKPIPVAFHRGVLEPGAMLPVEQASTVLVCGFIGCDPQALQPARNCMIGGSGLSIFNVLDRRGGKDVVGKHPEFRSTG